MHTFGRAVARAYFSHWPIDKGKWRVWTWLSPRLAADHRTDVEAHLKYGLRARLDLTEYIQRFAYYWSCWDPNEVWVVRQLLRPGDTFVDAGANFGYFSMLGSRLVGPTGRVMAFEPTPPTAQWLKRNLALNGATNVSVREQAISDSPGTVRIRKPSAQNSGVNTIRAVDGALDSWDVPAVRLDDVFAEGERVRLMKVDIEGAELMLARGFRAHMAHGFVDFVLCEVHDDYLRQLGSSSQDFFELMTSYGYRAFSFAGQRFSPLLHLRPGTAEERDQMNVLFTRGSLPE